jgi:hypothetical protein
MEGLTMEKQSDFCAVVYGPDFGVCSCSPEMAGKTAAYYRRYYKNVRVFKDEAAYDAALAAHRREWEEQVFRQMRQVNL